jgi:hypothetical protein
MRHYLTKEHRARITAPGWDAKITYWDHDMAMFQMHGRSCALLRQGSGYIPTIDREPLCDDPQIPDTALAYIWRAVHNPNHTQP